MPTPIPIIDASWVVKSGVAIVWLSSSTRPRPMPIPNSAVMIGKPIASTDPKTTSRMTIAARMPISSAAPSEGASGTLATQCGAHVRRRVGVDRVLDLVDRAVETFSSAWSNRIVA